MFEEIFEKIVDPSKLEEDEDNPAVKDWTPRYDPTKNLRSKIIDMFYEEGYSLVDEAKDDEGVHLEFKMGDSIVKVVLPS